MLWVLTRSAKAGTSDEYPQYMFTWKNEEYSFSLELWYGLLSTPMGVNNLSICYCSGSILWKVIDWSYAIFHGLLNIIITLL